MFMMLGSLNLSNHTSQVVVVNDDRFAPVAYLRIKNLHLEPKGEIMPIIRRPLPSPFLPISGDIAPTESRRSCSLDVQLSNHQVVCGQSFGHFVVPG